MSSSMQLLTLAKLKAEKVKQSAWSQQSLYPLSCLANPPSIELRTGTHQPSAGEAVSRFRDMSTRHYLPFKAFCSSTLSKYHILLLN